MIAYYVDNACDDDVDREGVCIVTGDLIVRELVNDDEGQIVSSKYTTMFRLCSARCARKCHGGSFKGDVFTCHYITPRRRFNLFRKNVFKLGCW